MRDLFFSSLRKTKSEEGKKYAEYWANSYVHTSFVRNQLIDLISDEEVLDCFAYLRSKFLKAPKYNIALTNGNSYQKLINNVRKLRNSNVIDKLSFVSEMDTEMGQNPIFRERFLNVLRKGIVYDNSIDLVDVLFGISFLGREAFYEVKRRTSGISGSNDVATEFPHLEDVKNLALLIDDSFFMRLARPFLIERLSAMFNKKTDLYYFVKFLLTVHMARNYKEYKTMSRFFVALEAHSKTGVYGIFLRILQYGWLYSVLAVLFFVAPLGTLLSVLGIALARMARRFSEKHFPEMALNANFQLT